MMYGILKPPEKLLEWPPTAPPKNPYTMLPPEVKVVNIFDLAKPFLQPTTTTSPSPTITSPATTTPPATVATQTVTVTVVNTVTVPTTVTQTVVSTSTVTTTVTQTVTEWGTATIIAVVLFIVGLAIGYIIKRR
jgi:hypothetical protein